jgi:Fur family ferric uptake transcriptional regulator
MGQSSTGEMQWFWDQLEAYLDAKQLKQTKQRRLIAETLVSMGRHVDAESLYARASQTPGLQSVGLATIYRTLNLLEQADVVEQQKFADGRSLFELKYPGDHHDHLICLDCGRIFEFNNPQIEKIQEQVAEKFGMILEHHRLDMYGRCVRKGSDGKGCDHPQAEY